MQISLQGKRVFITAGGAGMGRATAIAIPYGEVFLRHAQRMVSQDETYVMNCRL